MPTSLLTYFSSVLDHIDVSMEEPKLPNEKSWVLLFQSKVTSKCLLHFEVENSYVTPLNKQHVA